MNIYFWANGFSIDDGPLRDPNDPANKRFLDEVSKGYVCVYILVYVYTIRCEYE